MQKRFSEEQIVGILRAAETGDRSVGEVCRAHSVSESATVQGAPAVGVTTMAGCSCPK